MVSAVDYFCLHSHENTGSRDNRQLLLQRLVLQPGRMTHASGAPVRPVTTRKISGKGWKCSIQAVPVHMTYVEIMQRSVEIM